MDTATIILDSINITVGPGDAIMVTSALPPDLDALRPMEFQFADPDLWTINEFKICNTSQLAHGDGCPALELANALKDGGCDTIQRRMDVSMVATHHGDGRRLFWCTLTGLAVRH